MHEITTETMIFSFDGRVLEVFNSKGESKRFHINHIMSIKVNDRGRKGHRLEFDYTPIKMPIVYGMNDVEMAKVQAFVDAIINAKS